MAYAKTKPPESASAEANSSFLELVKLEDQTERYRACQFPCPGREPLLDRIRVVVEESV